MDEAELIELLEVFDGLPNADEGSPSVAEQLAEMTFAIHGLLRFSGDPDVRVLAASALARLDPSSNVSARIALLREVGPESAGIHTAYAWGAASALASIGPAAHEAVPALRACLELDGSSDELTRLLQLSAAEAIWRISGNTDAALQIASTLLNDSECSLRADAAELLGNLGPAARPSIPELRRRLNDCEEWVRQKAAEALVSLRAADNAG